MTDQITPTMQGSDIAKSMNDPLQDVDINLGLAQVDPLTLRPRMSSRVLCLVFAVILGCAAWGVWALAVCTADGQSYDDMIFRNFYTLLPGWISPVVWIFTNSKLVVVLCVSIGAIAFTIAAVRRRWRTLVELAVFAAGCYAATFLKEALRRPFIINTESSYTNSAPSGHTILATAAGLALLYVVPRALRAAAAMFASCLSILVAMSVIAGKWHRPSDVVMSVLLVGAVGLFVMAFTGGSGMDPAGKRSSSASIQIVASSSITLGALAWVYAAYVIWQIAPGLSLSAQWAQTGAQISAIAAVIGTAILVFGIVLACRQLTAAPLSRIGLVGAPPMPPRN